MPDSRPRAPHLEPVEMLLSSQGGLYERVLAACGPWPDVDWEAAVREPWSSTEALLVRTAAALARGSGPLADLRAVSRLDDRQFGALVTALTEWRASF